ncbi:hypothetical protein LshimejAT787_0300140 [Lyophyllum shimeji]|uniref:Uncharacterized protein n=1 Tax=Lyophyllum shimeji TaxID=47721 RepID=A0A9P3ULU6_LYOSH|nr:hypothetical protein LshimejAT787_0300140 [Lyophyllum shimeji]
MNLCENTVHCTLYCIGVPYCGSRRFCYRSRKRRSTCTVARQDVPTVNPTMVPKEPSGSSIQVVAPGARSGFGNAIAVQWR